MAVRRIDNGIDCNGVILDEKTAYHVMALLIHEARVEDVKSELSEHYSETDIENNPKLIEAIANDYEEYVDDNERECLLSFCLDNAISNYEEEIEETLTEIDDEDEDDYDDEDEDDYE